MTQTYTPLPIGGTPAFGTSGNAVKEYQAKLNAQNQGVAGYVPLKVDGLYGPLTQAASQFKPTIGSVYNVPPLQDPSIGNAASALDEYYRKGGSVVNEDEIRNNILRQFQGEIDATNAIYAEKLRLAKIAGNGRLGSSTAIQARRGLLGSDFGGAETDTINTGNRQIESGILDEQRAAVAAILGQADAMAAERIAAKNKAIGEGLDSHLKFLKDSVAQKATNATKAAQYIYAQGLTLDKLTPDELKKTADGYGVSVDEIKAAFSSAKKTADEEAAKAKKANQTVVSKNSVIVNPDGTVTTPTPTGSVPTTKKTVVKGSVTSGKAVFSPQQLSDFSSALESSKGPDNYVDPAAYLDAYKAWTDPTVGGLGKDFLLKYPPKKYVNPANNTLPVYLRSSTTTKATSTRKLPGQ